jgi:hypothetical protein
MVAAVSPPGSKKSVLEEIRRFWIEEAGVRVPAS